MKYIDIENIVENKINKHSNDYKNTIYTDKEYNIVSKELIDNIDNAAFWTSKKNANSWKKTIEYKYPDAILVEAGLKIKK